MQKDHQTATIASLKQYGRDADEHWTEVMELAEKYGFILQAYGEPEYLRIQQMNGHCPKDYGYNGCLEADGAPKACGSCWAVQNGTKWVRFEKNPARDK